jgi:hypothetical protein
MTPDVLSFDEARKASTAAARTILLGNGFSIAQGGAQFSYSNLLERCGLEFDSPIRKVFQTLNTVDFEEVMRALEHAAQIETAYGDNDRSKRFQLDSNVTRESLIHAIREVHPGIQFDIPDEQRNACGAFLQNFTSIFTLNYDLLLYWVILKLEVRRHSDGFGLGEEVGGFRIFQTDAHCTTHYLHGALHLFLDDQLETRKRILTNTTIIEDIALTIRATKRMPLFVAEGSASQKMAKINAVPYLRHSYERLTEIEGSVFIFGHSASDNDRHVYDAIFKSKINNLFFCVHRPDRNWAPVHERLARYGNRRRNIDIIYVDAETAHVWGDAG